MIVNVIWRFSIFYIDFVCLLVGQGSSYEEKIATISGGNVQDGNSAWFSAFLHVLAGKRRDGPHCLSRTTGT